MGETGRVLRRGGGGRDRERGILKQGGGGGDREF